MTAPTSVQLAKLVNRVPDRFVKQVDVGGGHREPYVPHDVIEQLLLYIIGPFDFEVIELIRGDVPATPPNPQGSSKRAKEGTPALHNVVVGALCRLSCEVDGRHTTITEIGDVEDPHNWGNCGKRAKQAASDGLKRCAMRLGLALHIWSEDDFLLDKWLPIPPKDGAASTSGAGHAGETPPAPDPPPTEPKRQRSSSHARTTSSNAKQESPPAEPASPKPTAEEEAPAATAQVPPGVAAGAASNGHPADQAQTMEELAVAFGRSLNNLWFRLRRAAQQGELPAKPFGELADATAVKQLTGDDFKLARAWLIDHAVMAEGRTP